MSGATTSPRVNTARWAAVALLGLLGFVAFLLFVADARLDPATAGLSVAAASLVFSLAMLYRMVRALAQPGSTLAPRARAEAGADRALLRDEKRRLLRAINELKFDFEMGKLSEADFTDVKQTYELRAVEVMRALEGTARMHPEVYALLEDRGLQAVMPERSAEPKASEPKASEPEAPEAEAPEAEASEPEASEVESVDCAACGGSNDPDAKFCKHCGKEISA